MLRRPGNWLGGIQLGVHIFKGEDAGADKSLRLHPRAKTLRGFSIEQFLDVVRFRAPDCSPGNLELNENIPLLVFAGIPPR